jgi:hypothetical protein
MKKDSVMAISAVVNGITVLPDKTVRLSLGPINDGSPSKSPGQESLIVVNPPSPPELLRCLIDTIVWGGSDELLVGEKVIAERIGYTRIRLLEQGETLRPFSRKVPHPKQKK